VAEQNLVGATAAISIDGVVHTFATGYSDRTSRTPMRPVDRMLAGSVGKMFVAAIALRLEQEGALDLDTPISRWLSTERWYSRVPNAERLTLRHLLAHRGGVPNHVNDTKFIAAVAERARDATALLQPIAPADLIAFVLDKPPAFEPGTGYLYSDTGYLLAGMVLERVTGRKYYDLLSDVIRSLRLMETAPSDRVDLPGLIPGYLPANNALGFPEKTTVNGRLVVNPSVEWTGGGIVSTAGDLARWSAALFGDARWSNIGRAMVAAADSTAGSSYGLGVSITRTANGVLYGHSGWFAGYRTEVAYQPSDRVSVAFQTNSDRVDGGLAVRRLLDAIR
jgi:D-alanyl-D-alanine carboxypeptidase